MISEFPLFLFTALTGLAAGAYIAAALFPAETPRQPRWLFPAACLVLVGAGSLVSITHLGRPQLVLGIAANPGSALTLEAIAAGLFAVVIATDLALAFARKDDVRAVRVVAALLGIAMLVSQAHAYAVTFGVPAWSSAAVWPFTLLTSAAAGFPLWFLMCGGVSSSSAYWLSSCVLLALGSASGFWELAVFSGNGEAGAGLIAGGAALMAIAAVAAFIARSKQRQWALMPVVVAVVAVSAACVARFGFYMISLL